MPPDVMDPGDPETRPYPWPWVPRDAETGAPMLAYSQDDMTPRPGILNGRRYEACTPLPVGERMHRKPHSWNTYRVLFEVPDAPAIDPQTFEVIP